MPASKLKSAVRPTSKRQPPGRSEFDAALLTLSQAPPADLAETLHAILRTVAETMKVERVSVWFFDEKFSEMTCRELFQLGVGYHSQGTRLKAANYPRYFSAMRQQRVIAAADARRDPQTSEFTKGYLVPLDIHAMLDVPIRRRGKMVGVVCHEHTGDVRAWTADE